MKIEVDLDPETIEAARHERGEVRRLLLMEIGQAVLDSIAIARGDTVTDGQMQGQVLAVYKGKAWVTWDRYDVPGTYDVNQLRRVDA